MSKNYYDTLGVQKGSSDAEIKKAYRKKAMEWHPDKHKGDKNAEAKFKEINEAYQVLGDNEKKQQYDTFGSTDFNGQGFGGGGQGGFGGFDFGDIFGGGGGGRQQNVEFDMSDLFGAFGGGGGGRQQSRRQTYQEPVEDLDVTKEVELPIWDFMTGTKLSITVNGKKFSVPVKSGTKPGKKLKVKGKGKPGRSGNGDLYLKLEAIMPTKIDKKAEELISKLRKHAK